MKEKTTQAGERTQHTPGPWEAVASGGDDANTTKCYVATKHRPTPADRDREQQTLTARVHEGRNRTVAAREWAGAGRGKQVDRYLVERFKIVSARPRRWAWVTIGNFPAVDAEEARKLARGATAERLCFLRATLVGTLAPEGVRL